MAISPINLTKPLIKPPAAAPTRLIYHSKADEIDQVVDEIGASVTVANLRNLDEPDSIKKSLNEFNLKLRRDEIAAGCLTIIEKGITGPYLETSTYLFYITVKRDQLITNYAKTLKKKIEFIQKKVKSENRVYAMGIPCTLQKGTLLCTCNTYKKINSILFSKGFSRFQEEPNGPATFYSDAYQSNPKLRGNSRYQEKIGDFYIANSYGEFGHYFSIDKPTYLGLRGSELGISCLLKEDQEGVSIPSCRWLDPQRFPNENEEIPFNFDAFTPDEIEKGYLKLQMNYPFIQAEDRPQIVVFYNPQGNLKVSELYWGKDQDHIEKRKSLDEYIKSGESDRDNPVKGLTSLHPTWDGIIVRPQVKCQIKPAEAGSGNLVDLQIVPNSGGPLTIG